MIDSETSFLWLIILICYPSLIVDLGVLMVKFSPQDPKFIGSNPAEVNGFFQEHKFFGMDLMPYVENLRFQAH